MHNITLICSGHRDNGLCNAQELLKILQVIEPQVIFEEFRPSEFELYLERGNLEPRAINMYRKLKSFQEVPVDRFDRLEEIKFEMDRISDCVEKLSTDFIELNMLNNDNVYNGGFIYLNSVVYEKLESKLREIENKTIIETGDQKLIRGLEIWNKFQQNREIEMVNKIYEYTRENVFNVGVFIVGAAHKKGIVRSIEKYVGTDLIKWNFIRG